MHTPSVSAKITGLSKAPREMGAPLSQTPRVVDSVVVPTYVRFTLHTEVQVRNVYTNLHVGEGNNCVISFDMIV